MLETAAVEDIQPFGSADEDDAQQKEKPTEGNTRDEDAACWTHSPAHLRGIAACPNATERNA